MPKLSRAPQLKDLMDFGLTTNISVLPELEEEETVMGHPFLYVFEAGFHVW